MIEHAQSSLVMVLHNKRERIYSRARYFLCKRGFQSLLNLQQRTQSRLKEVVLLHNLQMQ